jgi:hypothetical protein
MTYSEFDLFVLRTISPRHALTQPFTGQSPSPASSQQQQPQKPTARITRPSETKRVVEARNHTLLPITHIRDLSRRGCGNRIGISQRGGHHRSFLLRSLRERIRLGLYPQRERTRTLVSHLVPRLLRLRKDQVVTKSGFWTASFFVEH